MFVSLLITLPASAQYSNDEEGKMDVDIVTTNIKCCSSVEDFRANKWKSVGPVEVVTKSRKKQFWWGGTDFKFDSEDKVLKKQLKKEIFAVMYKDTLMLNTFL